jgi:DNA-binding IclR family transcriptional regulator
MMQESQQWDVRTSSAPERVLAVLDLIADRGHALRSTMIARETGIPRASVYRLLAVMRERAYLAYDPRERSWDLGPRLLQIGEGSPTIAQALQVLEAFDRATPHLSVVDVAARAGLNVTATSHLVHVLLSEGLLSSDVAGRLALGPRIVALASRAEPIERLVRAAGPHLERLRDRTGETASLLIRDGASAVYLDQAESPRALRVSGWTGRRIPLAATASGAALTAGGLHVVSDAVERGVIAVACRIPGLRSVDAAVSLTAPSARLRGALLARVRDEVVETANEIAAELAREAGGAGASHPDLQTER